MRRSRKSDFDADGGKRAVESLLRGWLVEALEGPREGTGIEGHLAVPGGSLAGDSRLEGEPSRLAAEKPCVWNVRIRLDSFLVRRGVEPETSGRARRLQKPIPKLPRPQKSTAWIPDPRFGSTRRSEDAPFPCASLQNQDDVYT